MKCKTMLAIFTFLVMSICSFAQYDSDRYQGFIVWEDVVYPSEIEAYEKAIKMQMELYAEQGFPNRINIYSTSENIYYWGFEIDTYADIDTLYDEFSKIYNNVPGEADAIVDAFEGTHESTKSWTCYWDRDLSYIPEVTEESGEEYNFCIWSYNFMKKGKMDEIEEVFKAWVDLATEKRAQQGWFTYIVDMGLETPCLFWFSSARDAADFFETSARDMELFGDEALELAGKQMSLTRRTENQLGWFRKDLSYYPEEQAQ